MSLLTDIMEFVVSRPIFHAPIRSAFTPEKFINDPLVLQRLCFHSAPQNVGQLPYLVWDGPHNWDQGLIAEGALDEKVFDLWFTAYQLDVDDAWDWINAIEEDVVSVFVPGYFFTGGTGRIATMTYVQHSKHCVLSDQVQQTAAERSMSAATICFKIGWQR